MRAIIYTRVSSDVSGHGNSVSEQEAQCRAVCEREGWAVAEVLCDNDVGASRHSVGSRPNWRRLAEILSPGDVLVTWESSRAHRDLAEYVLMRDLCADRGVMLSYSGRLYDLTRGDDRFSTGIDALIAEREAELTRDRVLRAKEAGAVAGKPNGRLPYGYRRVINPDTGATDGWVPDEAAAPIVREIARRVLTGESLWSITRDLTARQVPPPATQRNAAGEWRPQRIRVMIVSPTYAGLRSHRGQIVAKGNWEALISEEDHMRLVAILRDPSRSTQGGEPKHLLSGIAKCGVCGSVVRRFGPKSLKTPRYQCAKSSCVARRADRLDELAIEAVFQILERPDALQLLSGDDRDEIGQAVEEARVLRARLDEAADMFADGQLDRVQFSRVEQRIRPRIDELEARMLRSAPSPTIGQLAGPNVEARWNTLTIREQRDVVRELLNITIKPSSMLGPRTFVLGDLLIKPRIDEHGDGSTTIAMR